MWILGIAGQRASGVEKLDTENKVKNLLRLKNSYFVFSLTAYLSGTKENLISFRWLTLF